MAYRNIIKRPKGSASSIPQIRTSPLGSGGTGGTEDPIARSQSTQALSAATALRGSDVVSAVVDATAGSEKLVITRSDATTLDVDISALAGGSSDAGTTTFNNVTTALAGNPTNVQGAIDALDAGIDALNASQAAQDAAMANKADQSEVDAEKLKTADQETRIAALEAAPAVDISVKADQTALDAEIASTDAEQTAQDTAISAKAEQTALDQEVADRQTADALLIPKSDIGTPSDVDTGTDAQKIVNVVELTRKLAEQNITGDFIGSSATFAGLPTSSASKTAGNGDWAVVSELDGANKKGVYLYDGSAYSFAFELGSDVLELLAPWNDTSDANYSTKGLVSWQQLNDLIKTYSNYIEITTNPATLSNRKYISSGSPVNFPLNPVKGDNFTVRNSSDIVSGLSVSVSGSIIKTIPRGTDFDTNGASAFLVPPGREFEFVFLGDKWSIVTDIELGVDLTDLDSGTNVKPGVTYSFLCRDITSNVVLPPVTGGLIRIILARGSTAPLSVNQADMTTTAHQIGFEDNTVSNTVLLDLEGISQVVTLVGRLNSNRWEIYRPWKVAGTETEQEWKPNTAYVTGNQRVIFAPTGVDAKFIVSQPYLARAKTDRAPIAAMNAAEWDEWEIIGEYSTQGGVDVTFNDADVSVYPMTSLTLRDNQSNRITVTENGLSTAFTWFGVNINDFQLIDPSNIVNHSLTGFNRTVTFKQAGMFEHSIKGDKHRVVVRPLSSTGQDGILHWPVVNVSGGTVGLPEIVDLPLDAEHKHELHDVIIDGGSYIEINKILDAVDRTAEVSISTSGAGDSTYILDAAWVDQDGDLFSDPIPLKSGEFHLWQLERLPDRIVAFQIHKSDVELSQVDAREFADYFPAHNTVKYFIPSVTGVYDYHSQIVLATDRELLTTITRVHTGQVVYTSTGNRLTPSNTINTGTVNLFANNVYEIRSQRGGGTSRGSHRFELRIR